MKVLSEKLSLVLIKHDELPITVQKAIGFIKKEKDFSRMKGILKLLEIGDKYLYVAPELFNSSLLVSIYGSRIDRTNEDSFDTLLHNFFTWMYYANRIDYTEELISEYVKGLECYAVDNSIENLWHVLNLSTQCFEDSIHPNFSSLLSFYSLVELLVLKDINRRTTGNYIHEECGRKLPYFYQRIGFYNFPSKVRLNSNLSEREIFENLTFLRHKVIHGAFNDARSILNNLFPISSFNSTYNGNTEDAESSEFQDQIQNLKELLIKELGQILVELMKAPRELLNIKNDINFTV